LPTGGAGGFFQRGSAKDSDRVFWTGKLGVLCRVVKRGRVWVIGVKELGHSTAGVRRMRK